MYGMDMRYRVADTYWLEKSIKMKAEDLQKNGQTKIVVSDVRFEIEFDWIKENGGNVFYVNGRTGLSQKESEHISEDFVNTKASHVCDQVIDNSGTLDELYQKIKQVMNDKTD